MMRKRHSDIGYVLFIISIVFALGFFYPGWAATAEVYSITPDIGINDEVEVTMDLSAGWSMISLPVRPDVTTVTTLFPDAVVVCKYEKGKGYMRVQGGESLEVGRGYWILFNNPQSYVIRGTPITAYSMPAADGWYMIGGCTLPAWKMVTSGKVNVVYGYTQGRGYERLPGSESLEWGQGYWILFRNTSEGAAFTASDLSGLMLADQVTGEAAYAHTAHLYEVFGQRDAGTEQELLASQYIAEQFEGLGYDVEVQPFSFVDNDDGVLYSSRNVIATKPGAIDQTVIVGAHYDCVFDKLIQRFGCSGDQLPGGAVDNASGVGVMMEVAKVLAEYESYGTIKFIAFGAEELGLHGSIHYASQMSVDEINSTIAMINLDCIGGGDFPYVYAGTNGNSAWVRDLALNIADLMEYDLRTSPATPSFEAGTIGDWSDHVPFKYLGIPIAVFEWFNWDLGYESEAYQWIMHSCNDTIARITEEELEHTADVVAALVFELAKTPLMQPERGTARTRQHMRIQRRPGLPIQ
jgi:hypothetical protein